MKREIKITEDGSTTLYLPELDEVYHSHRGAVQEAKHVFIKNGLLASISDSISVLEMGFGTGLNAILTCETAQEIGKTVHYEGIEAYPLEESLILGMNYGQFMKDESKVLYHQMHQSAWNVPINLTSNFEITKWHQTFEMFETDQRFDVIYFDAFGPRAQEEVWDITILEKMYRFLKPSGFLVTYCAKGEIKRRLKTVGFTLEALPGPPGKREMTRAWK